MNIPCSTCKQTNGKFCAVKDITLKQFGIEFAHAICALYPNHAATTDNSNLVVVINDKDSD